MWIFSILFITSSIECKLLTHILGGISAKEGEFPFSALLKLTIDGEEFTCGGAILNEYFILTAAHCLINIKEPRDISIIVGTIYYNGYGGKYLNAKNYFMHENFIYEEIGKFNMVNDIALIQVRNKIPIGQNIQSIQLPSKNLEIPENVSATLTGWGVSNNLKMMPSFQLQYLNFHVINNTECLKYYPYNINDSNICISNEVGKGSCFGDSGGPLVYKDKIIIGVDSWSKSTCAVGYPDVFTRVTKYVDWIENKMQKAKSQKKMKKSQRLLSTGTILNRLSSDSLIKTALPWNWPRIIENRLKDM